MLGIMQNITKERLIIKNVFIPNHPEYNEWIDHIVFDIKTKYGIDQPLLKIDGFVKDYEDISIWIDQKLFEDKWVKYKKLDNNIFELKALPPNPSDEVCIKIIDNFMQHFKDIKQKIYFQSGNAIYNESEIRKILFESLKEGNFEIYCGSTHLKDPEAKNRLIFDLSVGESSEIRRSYDCGYLVLEIKD